MSSNNGTNTSPAAFISLSPSKPPTKPKPAQDEPKTVEIAEPFTPSDSSNPLDRFRLRQDFANLSPAKKKTGRPTVGRPHYGEFFRVMPDSWFDTELLEFPDHEYWLVEPEILATLSNEPLLKPKRLYLCVTTDSRYNLWPVRIGPEDQLDSWSKSAHQIARVEATQDWVRLSSVKSERRYQVRVAESSAIGGCPEWSGNSLENITLEAFDGRVIDDLDHEILKRLRGAQ